MVHDLVFALIFLAMTLVPAVIPVPPDGDNRDSR